jgi:hypothetical protein
VIRYIIIFVWYIPLISQVVTTRIATLSISMKFQCGWKSCSTVVVTIYNTSSFPVQVSRAQILTDSHAANIPQLTKEQAVSSQSNSKWAVLGRTGQEIATIAPMGLSAAGIATKNITLGWWGIGVIVIQYLVQRAMVRATLVGIELSDVIPLSANGGVEYLLHVSKVNKGLAVNTSFSILVNTP